MVHFWVVLGPPIGLVNDQPGLGHVTDPVAEGEKDVEVPGTDDGFVHSFGVDVRFQANLGTLEVEPGEFLPLLQGRHDVIALAGVVHNGKSVSVLDYASLFKRPDAI